MRQVEHTAKVNLWIWKTSARCLVLEPKGFYRVVRDKAKDDGKREFSSTSYAQLRTSSYSYNDKGSLEYQKQKSKIKY